MQRRLAAILAADVVGYSSLMEVDEAGTLSALSSLIKNRLEPLIDDHRGRIVKLMGDGILAEFASVVDAVNCALAWQEMMLVDETELQFRIGCNLGDIIHQDDDIFGNGVNVAARLEGLAEPGGICVSESVYREVHKVLDLRGEDLGDQKVKNIAEPLRAFRLISNSILAAATAKETATATERTSGETSKGRDKPSIAILPFTNLSGDPEQEFFSDGMTEDIITGLARFRTLFVLARNSSFSLKGQNLDSKEIGLRLGVQYLVEGSVRKAGNRVRISAQLVEAETGNQIWAERFDRDLEDIFAVQNEVTSAIVAVLPGRVQHNVADRTARQPTSNLKAYELLLQGKALRDGLNAQDTAKARQLLEKAVELDPGYARVYMYLADTYVVDIWLGLADEKARHLSLDLARKGASLDNKDVYIQDQLGYAFLCAGLWEDAEVQFDKTLANIVNEAESMAWCGYGYLLLGQHEKAYDVVVEARRLDPLHPPALDWIYGQIFFFSGRYDEVVKLLIGEALLNSLAHVFLVAAYAHAGREAVSQQALVAFIEKRRDELSSRGLAIEEETIECLAGGFKNMWRRQEDWEKLVSGLRKAGLN